MSNLEYGKKKLEIIFSKSKIAKNKKDKEFFIYLPESGNINNTYYFVFPIFEKKENGIKIVEAKKYDIKENRIEETKLIENDNIINSYEFNFENADNELLAIFSDICMYSRKGNEELMQKNIKLYEEKFANSKLKQIYDELSNEKKEEKNENIIIGNNAHIDELIAVKSVERFEKHEYSAQEIFEKISSIENLDNTNYEFEWRLQNDLRFVSDKMFDIIALLLEKGNFSIQEKEEDKNLEKRLVLKNELISFCTYDISMKDLEEKLKGSKEEYYRKDGDFTCNKNRYEDTVCTGCKFDRCPKYYAAYVLYLKNKGLLFEKLKDREEYRKNVNKSDYFTFKWTTENGLKDIPENVYKLSEDLVEKECVMINPSLNSNNLITINILHRCSDIKMSNYDINRLPQRERKVFSNWRKISRSPDKLLKFCTDFECRLDGCPIIVAGYIYYLRKCGLENQILEDRKYYNEHKEEIDKQNEIEKNNKLNEIKDSKDKKVEEFKEKYEDKVTNIEKLIDTIHVNNQRNLHIVLRGENNKIKKECETYIENLLKYVGKISKAEVMSLQNFASKRAHFDGNIFYSSSYINIEQGKLYIINNIKEFINDYKLYKSLNYLTYNELRKKQFDYAISILTDMSCENYILLDATEKELEDLFELDPKLKFVFQDNIYNVKNLSLDDMFDVYSRNLKPDLLESLRKDENTIKRKFIEYVSLNSEFVPFSKEELANYVALYANNNNEITFPPNIYKKETVEDSLKNIIGMESVKENVKKFEKYALFTVQAKNLGLTLQKSNLHMIFTGNPGTGKTTIARIMAKMLFDLGLIKENKLIEVERKDLIAGYIGQTAIKTSEVLEKAMGGVLFVDEAYSLATGSPNDFGSEAIATLIKTMEDRKDDIVVIFAGYKDEMKSFLDTNPGIASRIGYTFDFPDYSTSELTQIFDKKMTNMGFIIDENINAKVQSICEYFSKRKSFGNGRFIDKLIQETIMKHATSSKTEINKINIDDIPLITELNNTQVSNYVAGEMLNNLVGMNDLKAKIKEFEEYLIFEKEAENHQITLPVQNKHMIFTGNPGTGKTTVARIIAKILFDLGIIHENKLVEVERKDLIASYIGQTAPKTSEVIEKAMGGVLFIDEAYSLTASNSSNDFGGEAIATLIKAMEDHKGEFIVIFAGYKKEMKDFLNINPGIASRIGYTFDFPDYTSDEYCDIFSRKVSASGMKIDKKALPEIKNLMSYFCNVENIGNGRFVDKVFQETLIKHSKNRSKNIEIISIEDIPTTKEITQILSNGNNMIDLDIIDEEAQKRTATHEIGHATLRFLLKKNAGIKKITINAEGTGTLGYVEYTQVKETYTNGKKALLDNIVVSLGGMASEQVFLGEFENGNTSDLSKATRIANNMVTLYGMSSLGFGQISNPEGEMAVLVHKEINKILDECFKRAVDLINENKEKMKKVIDYLIKEKEIDEEKFVKVFNSNNQKDEKNIKNNNISKSKKENMNKLNKKSNKK